MTQVPAPRASRVNPEPGFWEGDEPADDNPRLTAATLGSRSAAASTAEEFFGMDRPKETPTARAGLLNRTLGKLAPSFSQKEQQPTAQSTANELLDALTSGHPELLRQAIAHVHQLGGEPALEFKAIIRDRLNTGAMDAAPLEAAYDLTMSAAWPEVCIAYRDVIKDTIEKALTSLNPALSPALRTRLRDILDVPRHREEASVSFTDALSLAAMAAQKSKLIGISQYDVVLDALAYVAQQRGAGAEAALECVCALLILLPGAQLREIARASPVGPGMLQAIRPKLVKCANDEMASRQRAAESSFPALIKRAENWERPVAGDEDRPTFKDPNGLAELVIGARDQYDEIGACGGAPPKFKIDVRSLERLMHPWNIRRLDFQTLRSLEAAIEKLQLGLGKAGETISTRIREERSLRIAHQRFVELAPARSFVSGLLTLSRGEIPFAKGVFAKGVEGLMHEVQMRMSGGGRDLTAFWQEITAEMNQLSPEDKTRLQVVISGAPVSDLIAVLLDLSVNAGVKEHDGRADAVNQLSLALMAVRTHLVEGGELPKYSLRKLDPNALSALAALRIELDTSSGHVNLYGGGSRRMQDAYHEHLRFKSVSSGEGMSLGETAAAALITVHGIPAYTNGPKLGDAAVSKIASTPRLQSALARVASPAAWKPIDALLGSPQSPLKLPNGMPIDVEGQTSTSFDFRSGPDGTVIVSCRLAILNITSGVITEPSGIRRRINVAGLVPDKGVVFTFDVAVNKDGIAELAGPVSLNPVKWADRAYEEPTEAARITSSHADRHLAQDFLSHVIGEFSDENSRVLNALNEFERKPELSRAVAIVREYIAADNRAPTLSSAEVAENKRIEANISSDLRQEVEAAVERARLEPSPKNMAVVVAQLGKVHAELTKLVQSDTFPRFWKAVVTQLPPLRKRELKTFEDASQVASDQRGPTEEAIDPEAQIKIGPLIRFRFDVLAKPQASISEIAGSAELFRKMMPGDMQKGSPHRFYREQIKTELAKLNKLHLAGLVANLRTAYPFGVSTNEPLDPHVAVVIESASKEWLRRFESTVPQACESVLLTSPAFVPTAVIALWYEQGRITYAETKAALGLVDEHRKNINKYEALKPFAIDLRMNKRKSDPDKLADFTAEAHKFSTSTHRGSRLVEDIIRVGGLLDEIRRVSPEGLSDAVSDVSARIRRDFIPRFDEEVSGLDEPTLRKLLPALQSFRVTNVSHLIETRLKELAEKEPPKAPAARARLDVPSPDSVPPPPDELPPSPTLLAPPDSPSDLPPPPSDDEAWEEMTRPRS